MNGLVWPLLAAIFLAACASPPPPPPPPPAPPRVSDHIVLLPQPGGAPSAVSVKTGQTELVLSTPYATAQVAGGAAQAGSTTAEEVNQRFSQLLQAVPPRAVSYLVYFSSGSNEVTPASQAELTRMLATLATRPVPEVIVIGHTDRVGALEANDRLSLARAELIRARLVAAGVNAQSITLVGRGERSPLVPTADEVAEPLNRRVEVKVR